MGWQFTQGGHCRCWLLHLHRRRFVGSAKPYHGLRRDILCAFQRKNALAKRGRTKRAFAAQRKRRGHTGFRVGFAHLRQHFLH